MIGNGKPSSWLTVGEVANRAGVAVSTLHFYEAKGLIASLRTRGNQRRFSKDVLRRIAIIRTAQSLGISLEDICTFVKPIPAGKTPTAADVGEMIATWRAVLQKRIDGLVQLRDHLDGCIGCGCLSLDECPLRNPADALGEKGKGAVLLADPEAGAERG